MTDQKKLEARADRGAGSPQHGVGNTLLNRQVDWFEVYSFAQRFAANHDLDLLDINLLPGTPQWCGMPDDDAFKLLALVLGGVREALNHEVVQEHRAAASREISAAGDWSALAQRIRNRSSSAYIPRQKRSA